MAAELKTCANIKSKQTAKAVRAALTKCHVYLATWLKRHRGQLPGNGLVMCAVSRDADVKFTTTTKPASHLGAKPCYV